MGAPGKINYFPGQEAASQAHLHPGISRTSPAHEKFSFGFQVGAVHDGYESLETEIRFKGDPNLDPESDSKNAIRLE